MCYSNLHYLKRLPLHKLKIEQSLIFGITAQPADAATMATIIRLAKSLNLTVVAEGVENLAQLEFLKQYYFDRYHGFFDCEPLSSAELMKVVANRPRQGLMLH